MRLDTARRRLPLPWPSNSRCTAAAPQRSLRADPAAGVLRPRAPPSRTAPPPPQRAPTAWRPFHSRRSTARPHPPCGRSRPTALHMHLARPGPQPRTRAPAAAASPPCVSRRERGGGRRRSQRREPPPSRHSQRELRLRSRASRPTKRRGRLCRYWQRPTGCKHRHVLRSGLHPLTAPPSLARQRQRARVGDSSWFLARRSTHRVPAPLCPRMLP
mmetsp:Transcript_12043/g.39560  ORF Transcript_12043/g.39560 Transcript_12043/m.39560 type:complete len:215 (-) Transcript_12043:1113-1757(-)